MSANPFGVYGFQLIQNGEYYAYLKDDYTHMCVTSHKHVYAYSSTSWELILDAYCEGKDIMLNIQDTSTSRRLVSGLKMRKGFSSDLMNTFPWPTGFVLTDEHLTNLTYIALYMKEKLTAIFPRDGETVINPKWFVVRS